MGGTTTVQIEKQTKKQLKEIFGETYNDKIKNLISEVQGSKVSFIGIFKANDTTVLISENGVEKIFQEGELCCTMD